eukprot:scaffold50692_cov18-Prasinocladus_malaysianus.AAC.1
MVARQKQNKGRPNEYLVDVIFADDFESEQLRTFTAKTQYSYSLVASLHYIREGLIDQSLCATPPSLFQ